MTECTHNYEDYRTDDGPDCPDCRSEAGLVGCDEPDCRAKIEPKNIEELRIALEHWRRHASPKPKTQGDSPC
jgi:hypothetical protein